MRQNKLVWTVLVGVLILLINLPLVHSWWTNQRLDSNGVRVAAEVIDSEALPKDDPERYFVAFKMPADVDDEEHEYTAEVTREGYQAAQTTDTLEVEYLDGKPSANRPVERVSRTFGVWLALLADLAIACMLALMWRFGLGDRVTLSLLATADVVRCAPGGMIEEVGEEYVVRGDVVAIGEDELTLDAGEGRKVKVVLGGHANPVGHQQPAEVWGRLLPGSRSSRA